MSDSDTEYKKTRGAHDGAGGDYEWKMLTLVFLRMLVAGHKFQMASNMEAAGAFDDIVFRYLTDPNNDSWSATFLQLKHKTNKKMIKLGELIGLSKDFSLVKYCNSHSSVKTSVSKKFPSPKGQQFIIFTNASMNDDLVDELEVSELEDSDTLINTGGKVVRIKANGKVFQELCKLVDFKEILAELLQKLDAADVTDEEIANTIKSALVDSCQNSTLEPLRDSILKSPTLKELKEVLETLEVVRDKETYSAFLEKLHVYSDQVNESNLDVKIREELAKIWIGSNDTILAMSNHMKDWVKFWWQKSSVYLTHDSPLWLETIKMQTDSLSKSTIDGLSASGAEFEEGPLKHLIDHITSGDTCEGIWNVRVASRTTASSQKVRQTLSKFRAQDRNVLHVNMKALLASEDEILSAWATRWCRVLVVECDEELDLQHATRIRVKIENVIGGDNKKLLVLIAAEKHELIVQLRGSDSYKNYYRDNFKWNDLTKEARTRILSIQVFINGSELQQPLSDLVRDENFVNKTDLDVIAQLMCGDFHCGNELEKEDKLFVNRRLRVLPEGAPFVVNSVRDVLGKVVLVAAEPGMGKTTLLRHLARSAKNEDAAAWVIHIKLSECAKYLLGLQVLDVESFDEVTAKTFLEECVLSAGNSLEKLLFESLGQKTALFVDGVDEVCPHYEREVFKILSILKEMNLAQLWVASRPVFQAKLTDTLGVQAHDLVVFDVEDQRVFFNKVWKAKDPSLAPEKCNELTEILLTCLKNSLGANHPILGIPLMNVMIGETFQERMFSEKSDKSKFMAGERLDVMKLYEMFVKKKFDVYCDEKKQMKRREISANITDDDILLEKMHRNHRLAALQVLFSPEEISSLQFDGKEKFTKDLSKYLTEVLNGKEKIGIIYDVVEQNPRFVHRSFAEYFVALWMSDNFKNNKEFIEKIIFSPSYKLCGEMFNSILAKDCPLHISVLNRDVKETERLLNVPTESASVNALDRGGRTPLHLAVLFSATENHADYLQIVKLLIERSEANLELEDNVLGWEPLRYAEWSGAWEALNIILKKVGKVKKDWPKPGPRKLLESMKNVSELVLTHLAENWLGSRGETLIHVAAEAGDIEMLLNFHAAKLPFDVKDNDANGIVHYASPMAVRELSKLGLNLDDLNNQGLTGFQVAAQNGEYEKMVVFDELKASPHYDTPIIQAPDIQLNTCLTCFAFTGNLESVKFMIQEGASLAYQDKNGHTAAWVAMHRKQTEVMECLLTHKTKPGDTLLLAACRKNEREIVSSILSRDPGVEMKDSEGETPLISASRDGCLEMVQFLLDAGASIKSKDTQGMTPLSWASHQGHEKVVALLLRHGAQVNAESDACQTPLFEATWNNHCAVMTTLLENGAPINCKGGDGWTALHVAAAHGHEQATALLIKHGADVNTEDDNQLTPLRWAKFKNHEAVVKLLQKACATGAPAVSETGGIWNAITSFF